MTSEQLARYEFKKALEELRKYRGTATQLVSLYVPPGTQVSDVANQIRNEVSQASNIKSKATNKNVTAALESILARLKQYRHFPEKGIVFLMGHVATSGGQTKMVQHVIQPPDPVASYVYRCDSNFFLEPLEGMLKEKESFGLVVVDRNEATIGWLKGNRVEVVKSFESLVPNKHRKGGQSQRRFERLTEEAAHEFFKKVAGICEQAFLNVPEFQGLIIGGPGPTKEFFLKEEVLHHELQKKVLETIDVGYTNEYGLKELVQNAHDLLAERGLMREKDLMQRFLREVRQEAGGLSSYGETHVRRMIALGCVDTLLLSEKLRRHRVVLRCTNTNCGSEETLTVNKPLDEFEEEIARCAACNNPRQIKEAVDIVEELSRIADAIGSKVEIVSTGSEEGELLMKAFGGVAAILRFNPGVG